MIMNAYEPQKSRGRIIIRFNFHLLLAMIVIGFFNSCTFGFIKGYSVVKYGVLGSLALWVVMVGNDQLFWGKYIKIAWPILLSIAWLVIMTLCEVQPRPHTLNNYLYAAIFSMFYAYYSSVDKKLERRNLVRFCLVDMAIAGMYTTYRLLEDPLISRYLSTEEETAAEYLNGISAKGIISYIGVYAMIFYLVILFFLFMKARPNGKFRYLLAAIPYTMTIVCSQFTVALIFSFIGVTVAFVIKNGRGSQNKSIGAIFGIVILIALFVSIKDIIRAIINSGILGDVLNIRLEEILQYFSGSISDNSDIATRLSLYRKSLLAISQNYGVGWAWLRNGQIGGHSELFDAFAYYGVIFGCLNIMCFVNGYKETAWRLDKENRRMFRWVYILFGVLSVVNTVLWAPMTLAILCIIPLFFLAENDRERMVGRASC